jgi:hypothetical protein
VCQLILPSSAGCAHMWTELRILFFASEARVGRITQLPHSFWERMLFANNDKIPYSVYLISHLYTHIYAYIGLFIYFFMFKACAFYIVTPWTLLWPTLFRCSVEKCMPPSWCPYQQIYDGNPWVKNPRLQFTRAIKFCTEAPDIFGSSVTNLFHISHLAPRILRWLLHFWNICAPLLKPTWQSRTQWCSGCPWHFVFLFHFDSGPDGGFTPSILFHIFILIYSIVSGDIKCP